MQSKIALSPSFFYSRYSSELRSFGFCVPHSPHSFCIHPDTLNITTPKMVFLMRSRTCGRYDVCSLLRLQYYHGIVKEHPTPSSDPHRFISHHIIIPITCIYQILSYYADTCMHLLFMSSLIVKLILKWRTMVKICDLTMTSFINDAK